MTGKWFHMVDNNGDVYIAVDHITSIHGREVYLDGSEYTKFNYTLSAGQVDELIELINK